MTADKEKNILHARTALEEAAEKGAKLVVLPVSSYKHPLIDVFCPRVHVYVH